MKSSNGRYRTKSLFTQFNETKEPSVFSISDEATKEGKRVCPSLRKIYLSFDDPTEYEFAIETFGTWKQWMLITQNKKLMSYIQEWRDEAEVKYRSKALKSLVKTATNDGAKGTAAAKYIAEKGWLKRKAGAPSNEEREGQRKVTEKIDEETEAAMKRMGLHVVK